MPRTALRSRSDSSATGELLDTIRSTSRPLTGPGDLDPLLDRVGDARFVLLGEASHGTSEYYTWRREISRRLIEEKGFKFIAVEGDWPACDRVDEFIKGQGDADTPREALRAFDRWPTWMWANEEVETLVGWLRDHNRGRPEGDRVGFHGLDVYSLWESLYSILGYLRKTNSGAVDAARRAFRCFEPYAEDPQEYARATMFVPDDCEQETIALLTRMIAETPKVGAADRDAAFRAEQNARVVRDAEAYYRTMVRGGSGSWNVRDRHMAETLGHLADHYGPDARGIVWEHNTHVGDARFTDMADDGSVNVGQLARERWGEKEVVLVGFASHRGSVIAGKKWEATPERMTVPEARRGSWEDLLHRAFDGNALLLLGPDSPAPLHETRGHRAIGVVYRPEYEQLGNYVPTVLPRRYDALLYLDQTGALRPLPAQAIHREVPESYPSGQ